MAATEKQGQKKRDEEGREGKEIVCMDTLPMVNIDNEKQKLNIEKEICVCS